MAWPIQAFPAGRRALRRDALLVDHIVVEGELFATTISSGSR